MHRLKDPTWQVRRHCQLMFELVSLLVAIDLVLGSLSLSAAMAYSLQSAKDISEIALEEVSSQCDPIVKIMEEVKAGNIGLVAAADKIEEIAMASGLCKQMEIDPRMVWG